MLINSPSLRALRTGFQSTFQKGFDGVPTQSDQVSTEVVSSNRSEKYGWIGKMPSVRKWIGDRQIQNISEFDYEITNEPWESTLAVDRDDIEDDNLGFYGTLFEDLGNEAATHKEIQVFNLLKAGFSTTCYDGQNFFDSDHPVIDEDGDIVTASNTGGGGGTPWYLLNTTRPLKPIIFQKRRDWAFVAMDNPDDPNVFNKKEYQYGIDSRSSTGYGFWQMAYGSKQTLNAAAYEAGRIAMSSFTKDGGQPLGMTPNLLVVPPSLEGAALDILESKLISGGNTNKWAGTAKVLVCPWL